MVAVLFVAATCFAQTPATTTAKPPVRQEVKKADDATTQKANVAKRDSVTAGKNAAGAKGNAATAVTKPASGKGKPATAVTKPDAPKDGKATTNVPAENKKASTAGSGKPAAAAGKTAPTSQNPKK